MADEEIVTGEWTAVMCAARNSKVTKLDLEEPREFIVFDYGDHQENTLVFSQIGRDDESKTAYYFKNWQKEGETVLLDLFNWGPDPLKRPPE